MSRWLGAALIAAAVGNALNAGVFFAFSSFVMPALGRLPAAQASAAMRSINVAVVGSPFMPLFIGTLLLCAACSVAAFFMPLGTMRAMILIASLLFILGCFGVTIAMNVPLNDRLAAGDVSTAAAFWPEFLKRWTYWNSVRTVVPTIASILFLFALRGTR